ncbi:type I toxin-antitoxin system Ibs family toxin [Escherichia coli]|nr:type I toxin-antitoxin system Ibs family toxin [Escherichia coli]
MMKLVIILIVLLLVSFTAY